MMYFVCTEVSEVSPLKLSTKFGVKPPPNRRENQQNFVKLGIVRTE